MGKPDSSTMVLMRAHILSTDQIVSTIRRHVAEYKSLVNTIKHNVDPSTACFNNVVAPLANLANEKSGKEAVVAALQYTSSDHATQTAIEEAWALWREAYRDVSSQADLFILLKSVKEKSEPLDFESERLVN